MKIFTVDRATRQVVLAHRTCDQPGCDQQLPADADMDASGWTARAFQDPQHVFDYCLDHGGS